MEITSNQESSGTPTLDHALLDPKSNGVDPSTPLQNTSPKTGETSGTRLIDMIEVVGEPPELSPEFQRAYKSESNDIYAGADTSCKVLLCVVKSPGVQKQDGEEPAVKELDFLRNVKPDHTNIVSYFEITENNIFMEHCSLGSLELYLRSGTKFPVLDWTFQLCSALAYLHGLGWAHNQMYPCNILVAQGGSKVKICNFGAVTNHTNELDPGRPDAQGHIFDIWCLGFLAWTIERGDNKVPHHAWDADVSLHGDPSYFDLPNVTGMYLADFMRACWSHSRVRPTAATLLQCTIVFKTVSTHAETPQAPIQIGNAMPEPQTSLGGNSDHLPNRYKPDDHTQRTLLFNNQVALKSASKVRLGVAKMPRIRGGPSGQLLTYFSFDAFLLEQSFLQVMNPIHPNIVPYIEVTSNFIFVEHCPLGSLERYLTPETSPPVFEWTVQLCSALAYLHGLDCAHNQLWPCNILVAEDGSKLQICDFGTATRGDKCYHGDFPRAPELAITQHQTSADWQNPRGDVADIYSLGLLTWFMQHGGEAIPHNYVISNEGSIEAIHSHLDMLDVTGLQLSEFMCECWAYHTSRPTAPVLLERLRAMQ